MNHLVQKIVGQDIIKNNKFIMNSNVSSALRNKECIGHVVCPHILVLILEVESMFHKFLLKYVTTDTDFCHNQITYLVIWPYVFMADNILPKLFLR